MWLQFFAQDTHFTIHLFATLACLAVCWLYLDAWTNDRTLIGLLRWVGFGILSLSFLAQSTVIEQTVLGSLGISSVAGGFVIALRIVAFACIIASTLADPLQAKPVTKGLQLEKSTATPENPSSSIQQTPVAASMLATPVIAVKWLVPFGGLIIAGLYYRRMSKGLERHLRLVAIAFLLIGLSDLIHMAELLRGTTNPIVYSWVAAFGFTWWIEQLFLIAGVIVLSKWVWSYLADRFFSQLFMIIVSITVAIFLIVSVGFTALLLRNVRSDMVDNMRTAAQVVGYALDSQKDATTSGAEQLGANQAVLQAVETNDHAALNALTSNYLADKKQSMLLITNADGEVLLRGEDPARWGDSLSNDPLVRRALLGGQSASVAVHDGVATPAVDVRSSVPILDSHKQVAGCVITGVPLDQSFVDGLHTKTGLQSSVYGGKIVAATTFTGPDGQSHLTGTLLRSPAIQQQVLNGGNTFSGTLTEANFDIIGSIVPLKDADNVPVGMLLVAKPQAAILQSASASVELTFVLTAALLVLSIMPAYFIARSLTKQLGGS